jgi:hypothetical protein
MNIQYSTDTGEWINLVPPTTEHPLITDIWETDLAAAITECVETYAALVIEAVEEMEKECDPKKIDICAMYRLVAERLLIDEDGEYSYTTAYAYMCNVQSLNRLSLDFE